MIKRIENKKKLIALIVDTNDLNPGLNFITEPDSILQMGIMNHPKGHEIIPHVHQPVLRKTISTKEVIFVQKGKVSVDLFTDDKIFITNEILVEGMWIALLGGGHGFKMLEPSILVEVKNGPYVGDKDKTRFTVG